MSTSNDLKKSIADHVKAGTDLVIAFRKPDGSKHISFVFDYQKWYTKSLPTVRTLAPDRIAEFIKYYEVDPKRKSLGYGTYVIQDYIKGVAPSNYHHPDFDTRAQVVQAFLNQIAILSSIADRLDSALADIEGRLFSNLKDAELVTAQALIKVSPRAAGALAGVILEAHLQRVAVSHDIKIAKRNPTIADLNDPLKQAEIYDIATWRKMSFLADLRNLCSHKKDVEPTVAQVKELLEGVNWAIKTVA